MPEEGRFPLQAADRRLIALYRDFLPERVFDAHCHIHGRGTIPHAFRPDGYFCREEGHPAQCEADLRPFLPGVRELRLNMIPMPDVDLTDRTNGLRDRACAHVSRLAQALPAHAASTYVLPDDTEEDIAAAVSRSGIRAIKCYSYTAGLADLGAREALAIGDFLPEAAWVVAQQRRLPIILHMMREAALWDPDNMAYITAMARRYPDAPLILAHCARSFASWTAVKAVPQLEALGNIWFDLAAICEPSPMMACMVKTAGKRVLWGTDYPICMDLGRAVTVGGRMLWLTGPAYAHVERAHLVAESLMAFYEAALLLRLDRTQLDDIFYRNAAALFFPEEPHI